MSALLKKGYHLILYSGNFVAIVPQGYYFSTLFSLSAQILRNFPKTCMQNTLICIISDPFFVAFSLHTAKIMISFYYKGHRNPGWKRFMLFEKLS